MTEERDRDPESERFFRLMALHKYFLNASFLRDVFRKRIAAGPSPDKLDFVAANDNITAMSLWYATVYVVIEGWYEAKLADPQVDELLADEERVYKLKRFRHQVFHYQKEYDNPRLLEFLGTDDADAEAATKWIEKAHVALGQGIEKAVKEMLDAHRARG